MHVPLPRHQQMLAGVLCDPRSQRLPQTLKSTLENTFNLQQHELLVGHSTVVGVLLRQVDTPQADAAEVLPAGQACQRHS